jgi:hypothetical protein
LSLSAQSDRETYCVIVLGRNGTELLLARTEAGLRFPDVMTPRWGRVAEHLTMAMNREWGEDVICLFELGAEDSLGPEGDVRYQVTNHWRSVGKSVVPTQWVSLEDLRDVSLVDPSDYSALQTSLVQCRAAACDPNTCPFARLGWFHDLCSWAGEVLASRGLHLSGDFRQLNASSSFSLVRLETNGPAVWFKAVGEPNAREFPLTLTLARLFPKYIPEILANKADWNGWLMSEATGTNLDEAMDTSLWQTAAAATANLQIESIASSGQLLRSGGHDLRTKTLAAAVAPFMTVVAELMRQQPKAPPQVLSEMELDLLAEHVQDATSRLGELGIPDTLGHLDLNPGNIIVPPKGCVFLDWAEAYVGHPFFSLQYLLEHFRRLVGENPAAEVELTASYLAPWEQIVSPEFLTEAMTLAPLLAVFAYAAGTGIWTQPEKLTNPKLAGYLRALARRMNREADQLSNRRVPCLS